MKITEALEKSKIIKRDQSNWIYGIFFSEEGNCFIHDLESTTLLPLEHTFTQEEIMADNWIPIYKKKPSLSDKIVYWKCPVDDVQEAVKEIKKEIKLIGTSHTYIIDNVIEIIDKKMGEKIVDKEERK